MQYDAFVTRERDSFVIDFPDAPGCQTFAESPDEVSSMAREALEGWLEAHLAERRVPARPAHRAAAPKGVTLIRVTVNSRLAAGLQVRWARQDRDLSQKGLAELVGVTQQAIAKLEDPDANPSLETLQRVADALGLEVRLSLELPAVFEPRKAHPRRSTRRAAERR
ncbi:MAG: type II toxin-antitoxin system HicB family antitoxin [Labilithrix sp.]|nr:type II toxin-antitoxin system HicB family antitoxin [Labilithrix sp.]